MSTQCWFCEKKSANHNSSVLIPMHKVREVKASRPLFSSSLNIQTKYEPHTVSIPRCRDCETYHTRMALLYQRLLPMCALMAFGLFFGFVFLRDFLPLPKAYFATRSHLLLSVFVLAAFGRPLLFMLVKACNPYKTRPWGLG